VLSFAEAVDGGGQDSVDFFNQVITAILCARQASVSQLAAAQIASHARLLLPRAIRTCHWKTRAK
jgi:hypothetical protein